MGLNEPWSYLVAAEIPQGHRMQSHAVISHAHLKVSAGRVTESEPLARCSTRDQVQWAVVGCTEAESLPDRNVDLDEHLPPPTVLGQHRKEGVGVGVCKCGEARVIAVQHRFDLAERRWWLLHQRKRQQNLLR